MPLDIFISHSARDARIAEALINLLRAAANVPAERIRCTSVDGYRLPAGASSEVQLRSEVHEATCFIGLVTRESLRSTFVLFELGARWGAGKHLVPLLAAGAAPADLSGPLQGLNALDCGNAAQLDQLVKDIGSLLKIYVAPSTTYRESLETLHAISRSLSEHPPPLVIVAGGVIAGYVTNKSAGITFTHITFVVSIVNESARAITPDHFELEVDVGGRAIKIFQQPVLDVGKPWTGVEHEFDIPDPQSMDLLKYARSILPGESLSGLMFFPTSEASRDELRGSMASARFTCVDVRGNAHRVEFVQEQPGLYGTMSRMGIRITSKRASGAQPT